MKLRSNKGFTLIEVIVVAAIIAILAGILVPMIFNQIDESKTARAQADVKSLAMAIQMLRKDTGKFPTLDKTTATDTVTILYVPDGNAGIPNLAAGWSNAKENNITDHLRDNSGAYSNWKGPYLPQLSVDPWNNAYVINADAFRSPGSAVWVLSGGPNGKIDTPAAATTINTDAVGNLIADADDIGIRLQ